MRSTQVTTWRRYSAAEKKAYRLRQARRRQGSWSSREELITHLSKIFGIDERHHFADDLGSRVPTMRVNGDVL